ncbi:MAG: hypothetical protein H8E37_02835 [Planctomycetes bacterium]|nr:hypothetical protein [Planctomycetota bacterium]
MKEESSKASTETSRARKLIPETWDVPEVFRQRLGDSAGRQRAMVCDEHLLVILHQPPFPDDTTRDARIFWRNPAGEWAANDTSGQIRSLEKHFEQYRIRLDELEKREETATAADQYFEILSELTALHRAARNQHAAFQEARESIDARDLINFRDQCYAIERLAELQQSDAKNALDLTIARQAEEQAETGYHMSISAHRLNVLVAFFFPIATLCAIFGTNLETGLEKLSPPIPFLATIAAGMLIGVILKVVVTRKPVRRRAGKTS